MKSLGVDISKFRTRLRQQALALDQGHATEEGKDLHDVSRLAKRMRRGDYNDGATRKALLRPDFSEPVPVGARKRARKRGVLSTHDKINISYRVLIGFEKQADVARELRVSPWVVATLIHKATKNK